MPFSTLTNRSLFLSRHAAASLLAYAVKALFPNVELIGGAATDFGFFYDFVFDQPLHQQAPSLIDVKLKELINEELPIRSLSMMRENAVDFFAHRHHPFLAEQASKQELNIVSLIQIGNFYDLSVPLEFSSTQELGCVRMLEIKAAERRFEDKELAVVRLTGTVFPDSYQMKTFLKAWERLKKNDHRLLGPELNLFSFSEKTGAVDAYWHPNGERLRESLIDLWKKNCRQTEVELVSTPLVVKDSFLKENATLFERPRLSIEGDDYCLSDSRLIQHISLFNSNRSSRLGLPIRFGECSQVYQFQEAAQKWGLFRSSSYLADRVTTFCYEDQVVDELISSLHFFEQIIRIFTFEGQWHLVAGEENSPQSRQEKKIVGHLTEALDRSGLSYQVERVPYARALHGPRIERRLVDSLGREWRGPFIEGVAHRLKEAGMTQTTEGGDKRTLIVLTKSLFDSLDRFVALLIEKFSGRFPVWLAPEQARLLVVGSERQAYANSVYQQCLEQGIRAKIDRRSDKLGAKIHEAEKEKIPFILIIGDKEESKKMVTVRAFSQKNATTLISLESFFEAFHQACRFPIEKGNQNINLGDGKST